MQPPLRDPIRVPPTAPSRLVVLASGTGSLLESLLAAAEGDYPAEVVAVGTDRVCRALDIAAGAGVAATEAVMQGEADVAFCAVRPPGHHATGDAAMGFCLFNNAAVAARYAQRKYGAERVAIVDWDVHHGNGTQDVFWDDPSVLFCSTHQMPLYPGTGAKDETGAGNIVNAPLSPQSGSDLFREAMRSRVLPALDDFAPDLIIISAGFDAHHRDPLAEINLDEGDFDWATGQLMDRAARFCGNRLVSLLEGGYDLQGLSFSVAAHVKRLMKG